MRSPSRSATQLNLPVGVLVIDYHNQIVDGDFAPDPSCYPSVADLASGVKKALNASTVFSFWPEVWDSAREFFLLNDAGCLINPMLGGHAIEHEALLPRAHLGQIPEAAVL